MSRKCLYTTNTQIDWSVFYQGLTVEGKFFVDYLAEKLLAGFRVEVENVHVKLPNGLGKAGARELALSLMLTCWDGSLPESFPALVELP